MAPDLVQQCFYGRLWLAAEQGFARILESLESLAAEKGRVPVPLGFHVSDVPAIIRDVGIQEFLGSWEIVRPGGFDGVGKLLH